MRDVSFSACACCEPAAASSALRRLQSLHLLLTWRCTQMEAPPQSLQMLLNRLCSQMEAAKGEAIEDKGKAEALTVKEEAVVGAEAGERARVGMASSGASAESAGARGKRQARRRGDRRRRRRRGGRRGPGRRCGRRNARITVRGAGARTEGAPPSVSTTE